MPKEVIATTAAPAAIGPYSQAIRANGFLFLSGQIPLDPETGDLVHGTIEEETHRVMKNLQAVLEAGGSSFQNVVKTTIFLADMDDYANVNQVYAEYFGDKPPARAAVAVATLPKEVRVEIEAIALA